MSEKGGSEPTRFQLQVQLTMNGLHVELTEIVQNCFNRTGLNVPLKDGGLFLYWARQPEILGTVLRIYMGKDARQGERVSVHLFGVPCINFNGFRTVLMERFAIKYARMLPVVFKICACVNCGRPSCYTLDWRGKPMNTLHELCYKKRLSFSRIAATRKRLICQKRLSGNCSDINWFIRW